MNNPSTKPTFEEFYDLYANKKAGRKARKAWDRLKLSEQIEIMEHLPERLATDVQWLDGYKPYPATFLNGGLWEDEYDKCRGSSQEGIGQRLARLH